MRAIQLELQQFGHFRDTALDLDHRPGGLRIVVGRNEAGKSTIREALRVALFGPEGRVTAGRPTPSVELEAIVSDSEGTRRTIRRKGTGAPYSESGLSYSDDDYRALVAVSREMFDTLFCIGHHELRRDAHRLLQADGGLGSVVFGAALGAGRVTEISTAVTKLLEDRFTPRGRSKKIDVAMSRLANLDKELKDRTRTADQWAAAVQELDEIRELLQQNKRDRKNAEAEISRLRRIQNTAPFRRRLLETRSKADELELQGPVLNGDALSELGVQLDGADDLASASTAAEANLAELRAEFEVISEDTRLLDRASKIDDLVEQIKIYEEAEHQISEHNLGAGRSIELADPERLRAAITEAESRRTVAIELSESERNIATQRHAIDLEKVRMGLGSRSDEEVLALDVPGDDEIERARVKVEEHKTDRRQFESAIDEANSDEAKARDELDSLRTGVNVPSELQIHEARAQRNESWVIVREWFVDGNAPDSGPPDRATAASNLETHLQLADRLADVIITDTERAAKIHSIEEQIQRFLRKKAKAVEELDEVGRSEEAFDRDWRDRWSQATDSPSTPVEMRQWRQAWIDLRDEIIAVSTGEVTHAENLRDVGSAHDRLREALEANGHPEPTGSGLVSALDFGESFLTSHDTWAAAVEQADRAVARVAGLDASIAELLSLMDEPGMISGVDAIRKIAERRSVQAKDQQERNRIRGEIDELEEQKLDRSSQKARMDRYLADLAKELGIDAADLPDVRERSEELDELRQMIDGVEIDLCDAGEGLSVAEMLDEAARFTGPDEVAARLTELDEHVEELQEMLQELTRREIGADAAVKEFRGGGELAEIAEEREEALAQIASISDEVVNLSLEKMMLELAVDEARVAGEGDLLTRAGHWFSKLTKSEFRGLDLESHENTIHAVAVRDDGSRLFPTALSDGTLDQLWLAWRIAGIEHHLARVGQVPVIIDDVLVHFDDERSGAAFEALSELANQTQVIILTHHTHLVEVARRHVAQGLLEVTELEARYTRSAPIVQVLDTAEVIQPDPPEVPADPSRATSSLAVATAPDTAGPAGENPTERLLAAIDDEWRGKEDLLGRSGIGASDWMKTIKSLLAEGLIEQVGAKRGAKYRRMPG